MPFKCPGQDSRKLRSEVIKCKNCGYEVEIFSDELRVKCPRCKKDVFREATPTCIDWCPYAEKCVGEVFYKKYIDDKKKLIKQKILDRVKEIIPERIKEIEMILNFSEKILEKEKENWHIVIPASILYFLNQDEKINILNEFEFKKEDIEKICNLDDKSFFIINDALLLTKYSNGEKIDINFFKTETAKKIYEEIKN